MTLNEWEQSNIEVLTSREMGEWLSRRENRLLDKIRAEIEQNMESTIGKYDNETPLSEKPYVKLARNDARQECLDVIDKYK